MQYHLSFRGVCRCLRPSTAALANKSMPRVCIVRNLTSKFVIAAAASAVAISKAAQAARRRAEALAWLDVMAKAEYKQ